MHARYLLSRALGIGGGAEVVVTPFKVVRCFCECGADMMHATMVEVVSCKGDLLAALFDKNVKVMRL